MGNFLGEYYKTGAGASVSRSIKDIRETLIDRPKREAEATEDRAIKVEGQKLTLSALKKQALEYDANAKLREERRANELADERAIAEERARGNKAVKFEDYFRPMTPTSVGVKMLMEHAELMYGKTETGTVNQAEAVITRIKNNTGLKNTMALGDIGAYDKRIERLNFLIDNWSKKGKNLTTSEGQETGSDKFIRLENIVFNSARQYKNLPKDRDTSLNLEELEDMRELTTKTRDKAKTFIKAPGQPTETQLRAVRKEGRDIEKIERNKAKAAKKAKTDAEKQYYTYAKDKSKKTAEWDELAAFPGDDPVALKQMERIKEDLDLIERNMKSLETQYPNLKSIEPVAAPVDYAKEAQKLATALSPKEQKEAQKYIANLKGLSSAEKFKKLQEFIRSKGKSTTVKQKIKK